MLYTYHNYFIILGKKMKYKLVSIPLSIVRKWNWDNMYVYYRYSVDMHICIYMFNLSFKLLYTPSFRFGCWFEEIDSSGSLLTSGAPSAEKKPKKVFRISCCIFNEIKYMYAFIVWIIKHFSQNNNNEMIFTVTIGIMLANALIK